MDPLLEQLHGVQDAYRLYVYMIHVYIIYIYIGLKNGVRPTKSAPKRLWLRNLFEGSRGVCPPWHELPTTAAEAG